VSTGKGLPMFRRIVVPSFSGSSCPQMNSLILKIRALGLIVLLAPGQQDHSINIQTVHTATTQTDFIVTTK